MRKVIGTTILFIFAAGTMIFFFSACALFQDSNRSTYVPTGQEGEKFVGSIISTRQGNADSHYDLGCYMQARKKHRPAIEEFKTALAIDPAHVKAYNAMGVSYDALGDHDRAVASYQAALKISPNLDYALNNQGYSYLLQGRADLAVKYFKMALELDGRNALYRNNLGLAYARSRQYDMALTAFKESGDEARAHFNLAQLYYRDGRYDEARAHFAEASLLKVADPEIQKGVKAAGHMSEIFAKTEKDPETPRPTVAVTVKERHAGPDSSGFYTIPAEALSTSNWVEVVEHREHKASGYRAVLIRADHRQEMRDTIRRKLETDLFARLNEVQALELLSLQEMEDRAVPRIMIEVKNGNGVRHMARDVGNFLRGNEVIFMYLRNASHFRHEETRISYAPGYLMEAYRIAQRLPGRQILEEVPEIRDGKAQISIVIGRDIVPHLAVFRAQSA